MEISKYRMYYYLNKNKGEDLSNLPTHGKHEKKSISVERKDEF